ncbi:hypothetical protein OSB04_020580 [Centaurea solstitialis]|uniref:Uncharacterized protein n=1 Tax=Centaurea solstitialis TaxID=347529 RepID=A0AA38TAY0_9ASTR|nr:hypothetical protein OSB04_020580 [Centaurea solstitialis]
MGLKFFLIFFILTSIIFTMLYISTHFTSSFDMHILNQSSTTTTTTLIIPKSTTTNNTTTNTPHYPVSFAYLISASKGDTPKLKRTLQALYHPNNFYLIHLEREATDDEHSEIARFVRDDGVFTAVGNVLVVGKPNRVTYRGPTMLATTLHAMAMLLRIDAKWDWFINLSASDYPLVTQDGTMGLFELVFCFRSDFCVFDGAEESEFYTAYESIGMEDNQDLWFWYNPVRNKRGKPIMIDPGLYSSNKSDIWWVIKQRSLPTAFKLYTGSAWTILSRSFAEYCIIGWENLPRTLLLYYTNFVSSPEGYFQTVICNSKDYKNTTVNHDLHYITWDTPPKQHPRLLGPRDYRKMVQSSRPFARKFKHKNVVLDRIDRELLKRRPNHFSHGGWCSESGGKGNTCSSLHIDGFGVLRPGPGARRLRTLLTKLTSKPNFSRHQCR